MIVNHTNIVFIVIGVEIDEKKLFGQHLEKTRVTVYKDGIPLKGLKANK